MGLTCEWCEKLKRAEVEAGPLTSTKYRLLALGAQQGWCRCAEEAREKDRADDLARYRRSMEAPR